MLALSVRLGVEPVRNERSTWIFLFSIGHSLLLKSSKNDLSTTETSMRKSPFSSNRRNFPYNSIDILEREKVPETKRCGLKNLSTLKTWPSHTPISTYSVRLAKVASIKSHQTFQTHHMNTTMRILCIRNIPLAIINSILIFLKWLYWKKLIVYVFYVIKLSCFISENLL